MVALAPVAAPAIPSLQDWTTTLLASLEASAAAATTRQGRARALLAETPAPTRRQEDWRFTDTAPLAAVAPKASPTAFDPLGGRPLPAGLTPLSPAEAEAQLGRVLEACGARDAWSTLLHGALPERLLALRVRGRVEAPLELVLEAGAAEGLIPLRLLLLLEEGAELEVLQVHTAAGASATSVVVEAHLGRGARLRHGLLAHGSDAAALLAQCCYSQEPGSDLHLVSAGAGWGLLRLEPRINQLQGAAHTHVQGLHRVDHRQIADQHSFVTFSGPDGRLEQVYKALADGQGRSVFNGAVRVPREAQRTDASQLSRNLLLSDRARIDTKPELEIVADDVRCAHGATVSRLQDDELFYLQSRGIGSDQAARLLQRAFCEEVLRELPAAAAAWRPLDRLLEQA
ncbi:MAG: Fe-S cluster assembly protein SufD [Synechococcus sp.]